MLGQDRGDAVVKMGGVVEVFDVGAIDTEHVLDACGGKLIDDVVDYAILR